MAPHGPLERTTGLVRGLRQPTEIDSDSLEFSDSLRFESQTVFPVCSRFTGNCQLAFGAGPVPHPGSSVLGVMLGSFDSATSWALSAWQAPGFGSRCRSPWQEPAQGVVVNRYCLPDRWKPSCATGQCSP